MTTTPSSHPRFAVVISVYDHWEWLRLILDALKLQTNRDFEVVIADDGSGKDTVEAIRDYIATNADMTIKHVWQTDNGFRKDRALNKATLATEAPYLIFLDGDCVPHPGFIADYDRLARKGVVIAGRRIDMPADVSETVEHWGSLRPGYFNKIRKMLCRHAMRHPGSATRILRRMTRMPFIFGRPLASVSRSWLLGCNFCISRDDLFEVNGFDEVFTDPASGEDADLQVRLENAGKTIAKYANYALVAHRCHKRLFATMSDHDREIYDRHRREEVVRAEVGLEELLSHEGTTAIPTIR